MAYTIISQNNSTTTLSDGVNTITVPSRVNLTSGNFTIVEVNNNMATLEDGDGNVYRDIPCVATLAGEGGGGGSALPDQTGHSGEFLTTDGTDASWSTISALQNTATGANSLTILGTATAYSRNVNIGIGSVAGSSSVAIGHNAKVGDHTYYNSVSIGYNTLTGNGAIAIGGNARAQETSAIAIGSGANTSYYTGAIQLGYGTSTASDTLQVWSYRLLRKSDGTIPTERLTKVNSTITIAVADWNGGTTVTKTVSGITATGVVLVSPDPTDQSAYTSAGIICTTQAADSLTFTCSTTPSADIDVNVVML